MKWKCLPNGVHTIAKYVCATGCILGFVVLITACSSAGAGSTDPSVTFHLENRTGAPLKDITLGDISAGKLAADSTASSEITVPSSGDYQVSATIDSTAGTVHQFTESMTIKADAAGTYVYLSLPTDYVTISIHTDNSIGGTGIKWKYSYGSQDFGFIPRNTDEFLGVFNRASGVSGTAELYTNGSKSGEVNFAPLDGGFGYYIDFS
jgi:hypothetical protein